MDQGDPTTYRTRVAGIIDPTENTYHITFVSPHKTRLNAISARDLIRPQSPLLEIEESNIGHQATGWYAYRSTGEWRLRRIRRVCCQLHWLGQRDQGHQSSISDTPIPKEVCTRVSVPSFLVIWHCVDRNLKHKGHQAKDIAVRSGMQYKICRDTYHMFYIIGTEDAFVRHLPKPSIETATAASNNKWNQWLNQHWSQGLTEQEKSMAEQQALSFHQSA